MSKAKRQKIEFALFNAEFREFISTANTPQIEWKQSEYGISGFTSDVLKKGSVFASIPCSLVLKESYILSLDESQILLESFRKSNLFDVADSNVNVYIYCAYLMIQKHNKDKSSWGPYIRSLPDKYDDPLHWNNEDLLFIQGTNLGNAVSVEKQKLIEAFKVVRKSKILDKHEKSYKVKFEFSHFLWARSAFLSRRFPEKLSNPLVENPKSSAMLPLLDCFNHAYATPITWLHDPKSDKIGFRLEADVAKGSQVFNNYGAKSNEEFLMAFGFCVVDNPQDELAIAISTTFGGETLGRVREAILKHCSIPTTFYLKSEDIIPLNLIAAMAICVMDKYQLYQLDYHMKSYTKESILALITDPYCQSGKNKSVEKRKIAESDIIKSKIYSALLRTLQKKLTLLNSSHTEKDDDALFKKINLISNVNSRNALLYRRGQRVLLNKAVDFCEVLLSSFCEVIYLANKEEGKLDLKKKKKEKVKWSPMNISKVENIECFFVEENKVIVNEMCESGSSVLSFPLSACISIKSIENDDHFNKVLSYIDGAEDDTILMLYLIHLKNQEGGKTNMIHHEWLCALNLTNPLLWTDDELQLLGQNSKAVMLILLERSELTELYNELFPSLFVYDDIFSKEIFTLENFLWASVVLSLYSSSLSIGNEIKNVIKPINQKPRFSLLVSSSHFEYKKNNVHLISDKTLQKGDEIFQSLELDRTDNSNILFVTGEILNYNPLDVIYISEDILQGAVNQVATHYKIGFPEFSRLLNESGLNLWWRSHVLSPSFPSNPIPLKLKQTFELLISENNEKKKKDALKMGLYFILDSIQEELNKTTGIQRNFKNKKSERFILAQAYVNSQLSILEKVYNQCKKCF